MGTMHPYRTKEKGKQFKKSASPPLSKEMDMHRKNTIIREERKDGRCGTAASEERSGGAV